MVKKKSSWVCKLENHPVHELGLICIVLYSRKIDSVPNFVLSFRLFAHCCNVHLFLTAAQGWRRRCSFKVHQNYFAIYCGSLRPQPHEGHRLTVLEMSWIVLCINNMKCLEVKLCYPQLIVTPLAHWEHLWGWMSFAPHRFLFLSEPTLPSTQKTHKKFPDWKAFLLKTSLIIQFIFF